MVDIRFVKACLQIDYDVVLVSIGKEERRGRECWRIEVPPRTLALSPLSRYGTINADNTLRIDDIRIYASLAKEILSPR